MTDAAADILDRLAADLRIAAWLVPDGGDDVRAHLELLAALPADAAVWEEVLRGWLNAMRAGGAPPLDDPARGAAAGALALAVAAAARDLGAEHPLGPALRAVARWCSTLVAAPA